MTDSRRIKTALISVYHKDHIDEIAHKLNDLNISIFSTGGTQQFIENLSIPVQTVESLTSYPSILGGRVKTLHPKVFGGILSRREMREDVRQMEEYEIPEFDLVIVDLYPFEETLANTSNESEIIEKIDIGGISLIRAAAKNYKDVAVVSSKDDYAFLMDLLENKRGETDLKDRKELAKRAFDVSSHYDAAIFDYFDEANASTFKKSLKPSRKLRYGENPHQEAHFFGALDTVFDQLHGKEISYNNLVDIEAAVLMMQDFPGMEGESTFAIIKHTNSCGLASRPSVLDSYKAALAGDPVSAFGGILICNKTIDAETAAEIHQLFCEVLIAPGYEEEALHILKGKKNRIILRQKMFDFPDTTFRSLLNGAVEQDKDRKSEVFDNLNYVTDKRPSDLETADLLFANKAAKHLKSNTIALVKNKQLLGIGTGQTSRVDALKQAILKAQSFNFDLKGAVMASDAFFPFPDCVEIAHKSGITAIIQPGGSIRDKDSIDYCNENQLAMVTTGIRHFKH